MKRIGISTDEHRPVVVRPGRDAYDMGVVAHPACRDSNGATVVRSLPPSGCCLTPSLGGGPKSRSC